MKKIIFLLVQIILMIFLPLKSLSIEHAEHREQGAHVHGSVKMNLAFDDLVGKLEIDGPGDSFIGFEHRAKLESEIKKEKEALTLLEENIAKIVQLETSQQCLWTKDNLELKFEAAGHSDLEAAWSLRCKKPLVGTKIKFNLQTYFPRVQKLDIQVLADSIQVSGVAKKSGFEILVK